MDSHSQTARRIVERAVGPVFADFYTELNRRIAVAPADTAMLYMTRAGIRLLELHEIFNTATGFSSPVPLELFHVSRLAAVKACMRDQPRVSMNVLLSEYGEGKTLADVLRGIGFEQRDVSVDYELAQPSAFAALYQKDTGDGPALREFFAEQAECFTRYLEGVLAGRRRVIVVDSGWYGTTQMLLMGQFPKLHWQGFYYGKWRYKRQRPRHFDAMTGLCVDDDRHPPHGARRLSLANYHLVESLLEPDSPSVTGYSGVARGGATPEFDPHYIPRRAGENPLYLALRNYLAGADEDSTANPANYRWLARYALFPRRREVACIAHDPRSADMGKVEVNPLVLPPSRYPRLGWRERYRRAIWKSGQLAWELPFPMTLVPQLAYTLKFVRSMYL